MQKRRASIVRQLTGGVAGLLKANERDRIAVEIALRLYPHAAGTAFESYLWHAMVGDGKAAAAVLKASVASGAPALFD